MAYSYKTGIEAKRLRLIPNLDPGLTATQAAIRETCSFLVSGGFYDPDLKPLGWLVAEGRELSPPAANRLFNGYVSVGYDGLLSISDRPAGTKVRFGLQSGPLLISNGNPLKLALVRDKPARRVVMFATDHGEAGFMVFYQPGFELSGPRLADLPELLHTTAETENLDIASAINLDGGSASAFISDEVNLKETDHVGEWWCVEPL
jgi:uncharacterized protein YigE (DUF2233 family)